MNTGVFCLIYKYQMIFHFVSTWNALEICLLLYSLFRTFLFNRNFCSLWCCGSLYSSCVVCFDTKTSRIMMKNWKYSSQMSINDMHNQCEWQQWQDPGQFLSCNRIVHETTTACCYGLFLGGILKSFACACIVINKILFELMLSLFQKHFQFQIQSVLKPFT